MPTKFHKRETGTERPVAEITRQNIKAPDYISAYANDVQVQTSPWDMRFIFGEISEPASERKPVMVVTQRADLRISLQLAKRLQSIIAGQIAAYEARYGPVPGTPSEDTAE